MSSNDSPLKADDVSDLARKDLDFAFILVHLGEEDVSEDDRVLGAFIKQEYDQQSVRRLFVRMFVSYVESDLFAMKSEVLSKHHYKFSQGELALLEEKNYELSDKGEVIERDNNFSNIEKTLKFTFRCYAKAYDLNYSPDCSGHKWDAFRQAIKIRNRVTHPKLVEDMKISDQEQELIDIAHDWFIDSRRALLNERIEKIKKQLGDQP